MENYYVEEALDAIVMLADALGADWDTARMSEGFIAGGDTQWYLHFSIKSGDKRVARQLTNFLKSCGFRHKLPGILEYDAYGVSTRQTFRILAVLVHTGAWKEWFC